MTLNETSIYLLSHIAKSHSVTHTQVLNILPLFELFTTSYISTLILYLHPSDDPNITNRMVSHYDCAKQHNLRQFNLLNVKQCTEAPSDIKHASVKARVCVRAMANALKLLNVLLGDSSNRRIFKASNTY